MERKDKLDKSEHKYVAYKPKVGLVFTSVRPNTLLGEKQGEHATAFGLIQKCISNEGKQTLSQDSLHVRPFGMLVYDKHEKDVKALESLDLYTPEEKLQDEVSKFLDDLVTERLIDQAAFDEIKKQKLFLQLIKIQELLKDKPKKQRKTGVDASARSEAGNKLKLLKAKHEFTQHIEKWGELFTQLSKKIEEIRISYNEHIKKSLQEEKERKDILDAVTSLDPGMKSDPRLSSLLIPIEKLTEQNVNSKSTRAELREQYFQVVFRELSEVCLMYQNEMPYVTFLEMDQLKASSGQASEISVALRFLQNYNDVDRASSDLVSINVQIKNLLFFPRIKSDEILQAQVEKKESFLENAKHNTKMTNYFCYRDNNENVFVYVVARHWKTITDTFPRLEVELQIKENFINSMLDDWEFSGELRQACHAKIEGIIDIYERVSSPISLIENFSLADSQESPKIDPGNDEPLAAVSEAAAQSADLLDDSASQLAGAVAESKHQDSKVQNDEVTPQSSGIAQGFASVTGEFSELAAQNPLASIVSVVYSPNATSSVQTQNQIDQNDQSHSDIIHDPDPSIPSTTTSRNNLRS